MKKEKDNTVNTLDEALRLVEKTFGKGTIMKLGDAKQTVTELINSF